MNKNMICIITFKAKFMELVFASFSQYIDILHIKFIPLVDSKRGGAKMGRASNKVIPFICAILMDPF